MNDRGQANVTASNRRTRKVTIRQIFKLRLDFRQMDIPEGRIHGMNKSISWSTVAGFPGMQHTFSNIRWICMKWVYATEDTIGSNWKDLFGEDGWRIYMYVFTMDVREKRRYVCCQKGLVKYVMITEVREEYATGRLSDERKRITDANSSKIFGSNEWTPKTMGKLSEKTFRILR
jgi:hypothetical protein